MLKTLKSKLKRTGRGTLDAERQAAASLRSDPPPPFKWSGATTPAVEPKRHSRSQAVAAANTHGEVELLNVEGAKKTKRLGAKLEKQSVKARAMKPSNKVLKHEEDVLDTALEAREALEKEAKAEPSRFARTASKAQYQFLKWSLRLGEGVNGFAAALALGLPPALALVAALVFGLVLASLGEAIGHTAGVMSHRASYPRKDGGPRKSMTFVHLAVLIVTFIVLLGMAWALAELREVQLALLGQSGISLLSAVMLAIGVAIAAAVNEFRWVNPDAEKLEGARVSARHVIRDHARTNWRWQKPHARFLALRHEYATVRAVFAAFARAEMHFGKGTVEHIGAVDPGRHGFQAEPGYVSDPAHPTWQDTDGSLPADRHLVTDGEKALQEPGSNGSLEEVGSPREDRSESYPLDAYEAYDDEPYPFGECEDSDAYDGFDDEQPADAATPQTAHPLSGNGSKPHGDI